MSLAKKLRQKYTYRDYLAWDDGERWEIIGGEAYNMTPAPTVRHQEIVVRFSRMMGNQLQGKRCALFVAPTDVVFSEENVVQPDIFVVCSKKKIQKTHIQGAPDLIIEVLSPATSLKDRREKKELYEKFGVKEYIIVDPDEKDVERHLLQKNRFGMPEIFGPKDKLIFRSLKGLKLSLAEIF